MQVLDGTSDWLAGGGETGDLIRAIDWGRTPLGPRERWPQALRTTTRLVVENGLPMALLWGRELVLLYNDACRLVAADRHPRALGCSTREAWPDIWHLGEPAFAAVLDRGETVCREDMLLPVERNGRREEAFFTLSCSPVRAEDGAVAGCLVTLLETTGRVRRQQALETEREQAEAATQRERELFARVIERIPVMVATYDPALHSFHLNAEFRRVLGWTDEDARAGDLMTLCYPDPAYRAEVQRFMEGGAGWREFEVVARDGSRVVSSWANVRLSDDTSVGIGIDLRERRRAEAALRDSEERFRVAVKNAAFIPAHTDRDLRYRWIFNPHPDFDAVAVIGKRDDELDDSEGARRLVALKQRVLDSGTGAREEITFTRSDGLHAYDFAVEPLRDAAGRVVGVTSAAFDITERKRAEAALRDSEEQLRALYEQNPAMVVLSDAEDGRIVRVNESFTRMLEFTPPEALGRTPVELGIFAGPEERRRLVEPARAAGNVRNVEVTLRTRSGAAVTGLLSSTVIRIGGRDRLVTVVADITDRKRAEEALHEANEKLREANEKLREANEKLAEADRRKNEFLAVLSHELRNPLAPIRNSIHILERAAPGGEQAHRARQVIDRQARHMTRLVDDLLDVTRISRGKIQLQRERVDLGALARGTAEDHRELYAGRGIELGVEAGPAPVWVHGDPTRLAQVVGNLLANSAKFTPRGGRTVLAVETTAQGEAVVRVRDNGAGIAPEVVGHLFEPFTQARQTLERAEGGLGLGLALVKGLVELHGGRVCARSEGEGRGAEFEVSLPLHASARPAPSPVAPAPAARAGARRVLVIDDNEDAAESLRELLELDGHDIVVARSGPEGVEAARRCSPDVVLCDIGLPGLDGYGVARALRADADARLRSALLVALSGYALPEDVRRSQAAGFDRHLAKPPNFEAIEKILAEAAARDATG